MYKNIFTAHQILSKHNPELTIHSICNDFYEAALSPKGNFDPSIWRHIKIVDEKNHVMHQCITPSIDQYFTFDGYEFDIKKGELFVINNNFKIPLDIMISILNDANLNCVIDPVRSKDHPMVILEVD